MSAELSDLKEKQQADLLVSKSRLEHVGLSLPLAYTLLGLVAAGTWAAAASYVGMRVRMEGIERQLAQINGALEAGYVSKSQFTRALEWAYYHNEGLNVPDTDGLWSGRRIEPMSGRKEAVRQ